MRNLRLLISFSKYCAKHPELRFWQALAGWSGKFIYQSNKPYEYQRAHDTFYFRGKIK